ncbi:MAG TPA: c-type cytochrome, partial [Verrucomicrobiae bacterium]|nr:c-type cytochrome [Verrucomicrobiae bacterium]
YAWIAFGEFEPANGALRAPDYPPRKLNDWFIAASEIATRLGDRDFDTVFARLATGGRPASSSVLVAAAKAWLALEPDTAIAGIAKAIVDPRIPAAYRDQAGELLAERGGSKPAQAAVAEAIKTASTQQQARLAYALAGNPAGAETLLKAIENGSATGRLLQRTSTRNRVLAAKPANAETRVAAIMKGLPVPNDALQRLIDQRRASYDGAKGSPEKGGEIFTRNCRVCHQLDGQGALVGPQLDGIGNRGLDRIVEDVLDPNRNVDRAFRTTLFTMQDGDVTSGLFRREEGEMLVIADSTGKESSIPKKQVKSQRESETSLMPENFGDTISAEDFQNLMAFLLSKRGTPAPK